MMRVSDVAKIKCDCFGEHIYPLGSDAGQCAKLKLSLKTPSDEMESENPLSQRRHCFFESRCI